MVRSWLLAAAVGLATLLPVPASALDPLVATEILGRPTANSISVHAVAGFAADAYVQYGTVSGVYPYSTSVASFGASVPISIVVSGLSGDTKYYYRFCYRRSGTTDYTVRDEHYFRTQRAPGSTYKFTIMTDSHTYDVKGSHVLMPIAMQNQLNDAPDFTLDMGDTFGDDHTVATTTLADEMQLHLDLRAYFGVLCHSSPLFFCLGNHDAEKAYYLAGSYPGQTPENNLGVYATLSRHFYYENPVPDAFYTGNTAVEGYGMGAPQNYYAWTWGDALFVVLDAYRYCTAAEKTNQWNWTLGKPQYDWLKGTLEGSSAKYKFVFLHHLLGESRGIATNTDKFEWGGYDQNGTTYSFGTQRSGWAMPVHQLLVANRVTACFQGHDHLFAREQVDGIVYQECPMPSDATYLVGAVNADAYTGTDIRENSGHLRVNVAPTGVQVDYVRAALPGDAPEGVSNGGVAFTYSIYPLTASAGANGSIVPNGTVTVTNGSSQTFTIAPDLGYHVANVLVDGSSVGAVTTYTFTNLSAAHTVSATFASTYTLTASAGAYGSIVPSGAVTVSPGASQTFTITPASGYHVATLTVDGGAVTAGTSYTFTNVTADHSLAATFAPDAATTASALVLGPELLGRPTNASVTLSVVPQADVDAYVEYGTASGVYTGQTGVVSRTAGTPVEILVDGLSANTLYYYRLNYRVAPDVVYTHRTEHTFHTQRAAGSTFVFDVQTDSHLGNPWSDHDTSVDTTEYKVTLANEAVDNPDFLIDMGDTFMNEKFPSAYSTYDLTRQAYLVHRPFFSVVGGSAPLFLVNGNHEGELGWALNGTVNNMALWSVRSRQLYYPNPVPGSFYSGSTSIDAQLSLDPNIANKKRDSYYSWTWGNALFVVLDPFWYTRSKPSTYSAGSPDNGWTWTLGKEQYDWFKTTIEASHATFKFVFLHNLVGGSTSEARGGIEGAPFYEWGGKDFNGNSEWSTMRPTWTGGPIHDLMVANHVTMMLHGHDHFYFRQEKDGVVYQECPQPGNVNYNEPPNSAADYGYVSGVVHSSSGHMRFTVSPTSVLVEYVRAFRPGDETSLRHNRDIGYSYTLLPTATTYTLTYTAGAHGSIDGSSPQIVASGGSGSPVTAVADAGYHFVSWSDDGLTHNASRTDVNVTADLSVSAAFAANPGVTAPTLTVSQQLTGNEPGSTTKINLGWGALESGQTIELWRASFGHYPEYDDAGGTAVTTVPPAAGWTQIALGLGGVSYADAPVARDYYYYAAVVTDGYGTRSAVSNVGSALDYHLGDVSDGITAGTGNDRVLLEDFSLLGAHYGATLGVADPFGYLDVGPTSTGWLDGVPTTDNALEFEDLVMFSMNYSAVSAPQSSARPVALAAAASDALVLDRPQKVALGAPLTVSLTLQGSGTLRALSTKLAWDAAVVEPVGYEAGAWLTSQGGVAFSPKPGAVDAAVLRAAGLAGEGLLATVSFKVVAAGDPKIRIGALDGRDAGNHKVAVAQSERQQAPQAPTVTSLDFAQPNPFRGTTALAFSLAQRGAVELAIYAVDGRRVRTLVSAVREPGVYRESWDGTDEQGRAIPMGVYFARLAAGKSRCTRSIVYLK